MATAPAARSATAGHVLRPEAARPESAAARAALRYYPFTLLGTAFLAGTGYLAGSAFATDNGYEFALAAAAAFVLGVLAVDGRLQARRMAAVALTWGDTAQPLYARTAGGLDLQAAGAPRPHYFYRLHARVTGRLRAGNRAALLLRAEVSSASAELPIGLTPPVCGELSVRARLAVRDVFGLTRSHLPRRDERRVLTVRPAPLSMRSAPRIDMAVGDDTSRRRRSSDEERYYMREYQPGDRLKDINWKASSRAGELITRISPISEHRTRLLHVELRHFRPAGPDTLDSVLHLDYLKSWLLAFLRAVKAGNEDFTFCVITGEGEHDVDTDDDVEELARRLGPLTYAPGTEYRSESLPHELFIFTTAFDAGLAAHVARLGDTAVHVYRTVSAMPPRTEDDGRVRLRLLRPAPAVLAPGAWALRRERFMVGPSIRGANVHVEEEPLEAALA